MTRSVEGQGPPCPSVRPLAIRRASGSCLFQMRVYFTRKRGGARSSLPECASIGSSAGKRELAPPGFAYFKCASIHTSRASVEGQGPPCPSVRPPISPAHSTLPATRKPRSGKWTTGSRRPRSDARIADSVLKNVPPSTNRNVASAKSVHSSTFPPMSKAP
jgi:hypothetical protein